MLNTVTVILIATINTKNISYFISSNLIYALVYMEIFFVFVFLAALGLSCGF